MTSHAPAIDLSHDQPPLPNQHFSSWLRGQTTLFISQIVAVLGSVSLIASTIYYVYSVSKTGKTPDLLTFKLIVDYAHLVFIAVFILVLIRFLDDNERGSYRVELVYERVFKEPRKGEEKIKDVLESRREQLHKFKRRFLWFWVGMLCLYASFACQHTYQASFEQVKEPAGKNVSLSFGVKGQEKEEILKAELSLNVNDETYAAASDDLENETGKSDPEQLDMKLFFSSLAFFFNNLTLWFVFLCFLVMYIRPDEVKQKEWRYKLGSAVVVAFLTFLFLLFLFLKKDYFTAQSAGDYISIFDALSGLINAVVLALLIARLDSKLVGLPSWLISILYSYAAVQPLFLVFELSDSKLLNAVSTLVLIFVFVFKIYFFLIIIYALQTGKMLNYLSSFPVLRERADVPAPRDRNRGGRAQPVVRAPRFKRPMGFGLSFLRKPAKRSPRARRRRLSLFGRLKRVYASGLIRWLTLMVSRFLASRYSLKISGIFGGGAILYFFAAMIWSQVAPASWGEGSWDRVVERVSSILLPTPEVNETIGYAQIAAVSIMIMTLILVRKGNSHGSEKVAVIARRIFNEPLKRRYAIENGEAQLEKFKRYFLYFWCAMFPLHLVFLLRHRPAPGGIYGSYLKGDGPLVADPLFYSSLEFVLSSLSLMFAFWCFVVLHSPAFAKPPDATCKDPEMMRRHFKARQNRFEARRKLLVNYSAFVVALLIVVFPLILSMTGREALSANRLRDYTTVFDGITGMLSAIVLALLIARMDSKLFNLPSWLIWMLFFYASIQTLFIAFPQETSVLQTVRSLVLAVSLGLKICFFLAVAYSLQSGSMLNYLVCFPLLKERVDSIFENQFEIRLAQAEHHKFTFSILKKNQMYYSTARTFESRKECDEAVEELRVLMGESDAYEPGHSSGTYWVEVRVGKGCPPEGLRCESIPLRSEEEALDLIDESMDKIPYCKYNRL